MAARTDERYMGYNIRIPQYVQVTELGTTVTRTPHGIAYYDPSLDPQTMMAVQHGSDPATYTIGSILGP